MLFITDKKVYSTCIESLKNKPAIPPSMPEIKKTYAGLASKYKLPDFDALNNAFEISTIEHDDFLLREIRRKIADKIEFYTHMLESILQPDAASVINMHEYRAFDETRKKALFTLYKELMFFFRTALVLECALDDKKEAAFIIDVVNKWPLFKKEFANVVEQLKNSWTVDTDVSEDLEYLG